MTIDELDRDDKQVPMKVLEVNGDREKVEAVGAQLQYLPPYSPDLNPIELAFAQLKQLLRSSGQRTVDGLCQFLGQAIDAFDSTECQNEIRHCGYRAATPETKRDDFKV